MSRWPWGPMLAVVLAAGCGFVPSSADPEALLAELASLVSTDDCVEGALRWGDKDADRRLTRAEFVDLTLIALDGTTRNARRALEDIEARRARFPTSLTEAEYQTRRRKQEATLQEAAAARPKSVKLAEGRFGRFDADHDGWLTEPELAAACEALAREDAERPRKDGGGRP